MKVLIMSALLLLSLVPVAALAQTDKYGKPDTLYADIERLNENTFTVTISIANDEYVEGLSVPLKISAGTVKIVGDSAIWRGGRVEHFAFKAFRADTAIQCVTAGLVANMGPTNKTLAPGTGRLFTIYISSVGKKPIAKLTIDTATTQPNNSLMAIADNIQYTDPPDTLPINRRKEAEIVPVFVVREPK